MHLPIPEQGRWLGQVVTGYFAYHAVPSNLDSLVAFHHYVTRLLAAHASATQQKDRVNPRWKPYAGKPHVRFCAGGA
jgi:hypothetical protein